MGRSQTVSKFWALVSTNVLAKTPRVFVLRYKVEARKENLQQQQQAPPPWLACWGSYSFMLTYSYFQYTWFYFPPTQTFVRVRLSHELIHQVSRVIFPTKAVIYVCGTGMKTQISITFPLLFFSVQCKSVGKCRSCFYHTTPNFSSVLH